MERPVRKATGDSGSLPPRRPRDLASAEGHSGYRLGGADLTAAAPFEYEVPAFTSHGHPWNAGQETLVVRQIIAGDRPMPELTGGVQGYFETVFAFAQRGRANANREIDGRLQNLLTLHNLLVPGTLLVGPPRWAQRAVLGTLAALARVIGKRPYARPRFEGEGAPGARPRPRED
jgi:hypothetical protein